MKKNKRKRSGDTSQPNQSKKKRLSRQENLSQGSLNDSSGPSRSDDPGNDSLKETAIKLPEETPKWGIKLLEILQNQFLTMNGRVDSTQENCKENTKSIKLIEKKLVIAEEMNAQLEYENLQLKEKLYEMEYQQKQNNLLFEGV